MIMIVFNVFKELIKCINNNKTTNNDALKDLYSFSKSCWLVFYPWLGKCWVKNKHTVCWIVVTQLWVVTVFPNPRIRYFS